MRAFSGHRAGSLTTRLLGSLVAAAGFFAVMIFLLDRPDDYRPPGGEDPGRTTDPETSSSQRRADEDLGRILAAMMPGRLGISSERLSLVNELNLWESSHGLRPEDRERLTSDTDLLKKLLTGDTLDRTLSQRFLPEDASHVRESVLAQNIVLHVTEGRASDRERIVALFYFVCRNISLAPDSFGAQTPLTPYETLLFGVGTAADRANVFAGLVRQMQLDAVILKPRAETASGEWLIGVVEPKLGVLLFDPRLGLPIPSAEDSATSPWPKQPATLAEVRSSDAPFRALDLPDRPYPLSSKSLDDVQVQIIGTSSVWAPRMAELQFQLPDSVTATLYDGLGENELRQPGAYQRIVDGGQGGLWDAEDVSIWSFPEGQMVQIESARGPEGTSLAELFQVFRGPYVYREHSDTREIVNSIERSLHYVRIQQLMGNHRQSLQDLLKIRNASLSTASPANKVISDYASRWTAVSQYDIGEVRAALTTCERYVRSHDGNTLGVRFADDWAILCLLDLKQYEAATQLLVHAPPELTPWRDAYLLKRWKGLADRSSTPEAPQETPSGTPPAELESPQPGTSPDAAENPQPNAGTADSSSLPEDN